MNKMEYLLNHTMEESSEVIKCCAKYNRFGPTMTHPKNNGLTNQELLEDEIKDFMLMVKYMQKAGLIRYFTNQELELHEAMKREKGAKYEQISKDLGRLDD